MTACRPVHTGYTREIHRTTTICRELWGHPGILVDLLGDLIPSSLHGLYSWHFFINYVPGAVGLQHSLPHSSHVTLRCPPGCISISKSVQPVNEPTNHLPQQSINDAIMQSSSQPIDDGCIYQRKSWSEMGTLLTGDILLKCKRVVDQALC